MALKPCHGCNAQVDTTARICPHCGRPNPTASKKLKLVAGVLAGFVGLLVVIAASGGGTSGRSHSAVGDLVNPLGNIEDKVAQDAVEQYNMVKRHGSPVEICVHAGMVSAAFAQAKDEENYARWKSIERADCRAAGMPGM